MDKEFRYQNVPNEEQRDILENLQELIPNIEALMSSFSEKKIRLGLRFGKAGTDGKNIYLPLEQIATMKRFDFKALEHTLIHECFHILGSQFNFQGQSIQNKLNSLTTNPWFFLFFMGLEDARVELGYFRIYPGTRKYLMRDYIKTAVQFDREFKKLANKLGIPGAYRDNALNMGFAFMPIGLRYPNLTKKLQKVIDKYANEYNSIIENSQNTENILDNGLPLFEKLVKEGYFKPIPEQKQGKKGKSKNGKGGSQGGQLSEQELLDKLQEYIEKIIDKLAPMILKRQLTEQQPNRVVKNTSVQKRFDAHQDNSLVKKHSKSSGSCSSETFEIEAKITKTNFKSKDNLFNKEFITAKQILLNKLQKIVRDKYENGYRTGSRLDKKILSKWATNALKHNRIFERKELKSRHQAVFSLLVDLSSSINSTDLEAEINTLYLFSRLLSSLSIPFSITGYYGGYCKDAQLSGTINIKVKEFDELFSSKIKKKLISLTTDGGTPTLYAFGNTLQKLLKRPEQDKYLILITDGGLDGGEPNAKTMKRMIDKCPNIKCLAFGIALSGCSEDAIKLSFGKNNYRKISNFKEIGKQLIKLLLESL